MSASIGLGANMFHEREEEDNDDGEVSGVNGNKRYIVCRPQINTKSVATDHGRDERVVRGGGTGGGKDGGGFEGEGVSGGGVFVSHKPSKPTMKAP